MNTMNVKFLDNKKHKRFTYSAFIPIGLMFWSISKPKEIGFEYRHLMQKKKRNLTIDKKYRTSKTTRGENTMFYSCTVNIIILKKHLDW